MTTFVVGTGSVVASAALCDYLDGRVEDGDAVHAAAWAGGSTPEAARDADDALNGVRSRLGVRASVETRRLGDVAGAGAGEVADGLRALAAEVGADELVVGCGGDGGPGSDAVGRLAADATRPVVVVPLG